MDDDVDESADGSERPDPPSSADDEGVHGAGDDDLPADVEATLTQLLDAARTAIREGRTEDALSSVDTVKTVTQNKLSVGPRRGRLLHGCSRVADLAADDPPVAAEYLDAMRRRLP